MLRIPLLALTLGAGLLFAGCKKAEPAVDPTAVYLGDYDCKYTNQGTDYGTTQGAKPIEFTNSGIFQARLTKLKEATIEFRSTSTNAGETFPLEVSGNTFVIRQQMKEVDREYTYYDELLGDGSTDGKKLTFKVNSTSNMTVGTSTTRRLIHSSTTTCDCFKK
jgi:hypothetical protein